MPVTRSKTTKTATKKATKKAAKKTTKTATKKATKTATKKVKSGALVVGSPAPLFELPTDQQETIKLKDLIGKKKVVIYFYPKDDTPGCTKQACAFEASKAKLDASDAAVIGISPDSVASHAKFRQKYGLNFILASDQDHKVAESFGAWGLKKNYGKEYMGIIRSTFIVGLDGKISHIWPKVSVDGHDAEVLEALLGR